MVLSSPSFLVTGAVKQAQTVLLSNAKSGKMYERQAYIGKVLDFKNLVWFCLCSVCVCMYVCVRARVCACVCVRACGSVYFHICILIVVLRGPLSDQNRSYRPLKPLGALTVLLHRTVNFYSTHYSLSSP